MCKVERSTTPESVVFRGGRSETQVRDPPDVRGRGSLNLGCMIPRATSVTRMRCRASDAEMFPHSDGTASARLWIARSSIAPYPTRRSYSQRKSSMKRWNLQWKRPYLRPDPATDNVCRPKGARRRRPSRQNRDPRRNEVQLAAPEIRCVCSDPNRVQDADVRKYPSRAHLVDGRIADSTLARDFPDGKQVTRLNPHLPVPRSRRLPREQNSSNLLPILAKGWTRPLPDPEYFSTRSGAGASSQGAAA
jgi:hypothetical protein